MVESLVTSVKGAIDRLQGEIKRKTSELVSLKGELVRHRRVHRLLGGRDRKPRRPRRQRRVARRAAPVNWNSVLEGLPGRFTLSDIAKAAATKGKSPVYLRQVAVRWAKQGKTKRVARGNYRKVGSKPRAKSR